MQYRAWDVSLGGFSWVVDLFLIGLMWAPLRMDLARWWVTAADWLNTL